MIDKSEAVKKLEGYKNIIDDIDRSSDVESEPAALAKIPNPKSSFSNHLDRESAFRALVDNAKISILQGERANLTK